MLNNSLSGHLSAERITAALVALEGRGQAQREKTPTPGRPVERWFAADPVDPWGDFFRPSSAVLLHPAAADRGAPAPAVAGV